MTQPPAPRVRILDGQEADNLRFELIDGALDGPLYTGLVKLADADALALALDDIVERCPPARPVLDMIRRELVVAGAGGPLHGEWEPPIPLGSIHTQPPTAPLDTGFPSGLADLRAYVRALATEMQVPADLVVLPLFTVAASAGARKFEVWLAEHWREACGLWVLILMESGSRKSPVLRALLQPLLDWQSERRRQNAPARRRYESEVEVRKEQIAHLRKQIARKNAASQAAQQQLELLNERGEPHPPVGDDLLLSDCTTEALALHFGENGERALIASAEADVLDVILGRYARGEPKLGLLCKAYTGEPEVVKRVGRSAVALQNPVLSLALSVQPEGIRAALANPIAHARGFWARCLKAAPISLVGRRELDPPAVPADLEQAYRDRLRTILDVPLPPAPYCVQLSSDARPLLHAHRQSLEPRLADDLDDDCEWASKLTGNLLRIALALHLLEHGQAAAHLPISGATIAAALSWADYLIDSEKHVAGLAKLDPDIRCAKKLARWLARHGRPEVSRRELWTSNRTRTEQHAASFERPIQILVEHGYLRPLEQQRSGTRGGRPSTRFAVNPSVLAPKA